MAQVGPGPGEPRFRPSTDRPDELDLEARWEDVRRIARSHPAYRLCLEVGWHWDDLDAEVLLRVCERQNMASRYDPARSGLGTYLWKLTGSIMLNLSTCQRFLGSPNETTAAERGREPAGSSVYAGFFDDDTMDREADHDPAEDGEWEPCSTCEGRGTVHDCGEDCCPCLDPDFVDQVECDDCEGRGGFLVRMPP